MDDSKIKKVNSKRVDEKNEDEKQLRDSEVTLTFLVLISLNLIFS